MATVVNTFLTHEQLYALETANDRIYRFKAPTPKRAAWAPAESADPVCPYEVVFRKPNPGEYEAFRASSNNEARKAKSQEILARATIVAVVYKGVQTIHDGHRGGAQERAVKEAFDKLLIDWPGIPEACAEGIGELIGLAKAEEEK